MLLRSPRRAILLAVLPSLLCLPLTLAQAPVSQASPAGKSRVDTAAEADARARSLAQIRASGELVMLTFPHQQSTFSRVDLSKGAMPRIGTTENFVGIDVDLMALFAERLGVELKIRPVSEPSYAALIPDLRAGRGDLVASSLTITDERRRRVDFSTPYFSVYPVIVARRDSGLASLQDLEGKIGAVMDGSSHEERLLGLGIDPQSLLRVDFTVAAVGAVLDGEADYTLQDSMAAQRLVEENPELVRAFRLDDEDSYGIALLRGSELKPELDAFLDEVRRSGRLQKIFERHGEGG